MMSNDELDSQDVLIASGCVPADTPAVWVVVGSTGAYSDRMEWNVAAFTDEESAEVFKDACQKVADTVKTFHDRWHFKHPYDPQFYCDYTGTSYDVHMVQLFQGFQPNEI